MGSKAPAAEFAKAAWNRKCGIRCFRTWPSERMSESAILEYLKSYRMEYPSLGEAVQAEPEKTMEKLRSAAYNKPELFSEDVRTFVLGRFDIDAYTDSAEETAT